MTLNFTIGLPVLLANQGFRIEYREQGDSVWIFHSIQTDNDVSITGLNPNTCYEIQITFLQSISPLIECPSVIEVYCLDEEVPCVEFTAQIIESSEIFLMDIDISFPSPLTTPCGGYNLYYGLVASPMSYTMVHYNTLPSTIQFPVPNGNYHVQIYAVDCEGNEYLCDEVNVEELEVECIPAVVSSVVLSYVNGVFKITITLVPSNPPSPIYYVNYHQSNAVSSGVGDPGGTIPFASTGNNPEIFVVITNPNFNVQGGRVTYVGGITDNCGYTYYFDKTLVV